MAETIISARGLTYQVGKRCLLKDVNWDVEEYSRWIVIGRNGCGKTTLLSLLSGYQDYQNGDLLFRGTPYNELDIFDIRRKMGWISGSFFDRVYHHESVLDILLAGLSGSYGVEPSFVRSDDIVRAKYILSYFGLENRLDAGYDCLSKGERQLVLIARALMIQPEVMLFDEPMTGLDVVSREQVMRFIRNLLLKKQQTMIYVTHHFDEISSDLFDHCMLLRDGSIFQKGAIEDIFQSDVISRFLGKNVDVARKEDGYYALTFLE